MAHPRLAFQSWPAAIYAIGDVHGCLGQLQALEALIAEDAAHLGGEKWLVTVGDHIDRGPASRQVIDHVMGPAPAGFRRFALFGNHESQMLEAMDDPRTLPGWLEQGGAETLASYGLDPGALDPRWADSIPAAHRRFIAALPVTLSLPGWLFVHAGIRPGVPLADQSDRDLIWIRAPFLTSQLTGGVRVVHGHTPVPDVAVTPHRIDIDTGCFATGRLSAVRVTPDGQTRFFSVEGPVSGRFAASAG